MSALSLRASSASYFGRRKRIYQTFRICPRSMTWPTAKNSVSFVFSSVEFGRPYVLPPDVPKERTDLVRKSFAAAVHDPELIAEANKMKLDMTYRAPDALER